MARTTRESQKCTWRTIPITCFEKPEPERREGRGERRERGQKRGERRKERRERGERRGQRREEKGKRRGEKEDRREER